jgi:hypothetical protein
MSEERVSRLKRVILLVFCVLIAGGVGVGVTFMAIDILSKRRATIINAAFDANTLTYRDGRLQLYFDVTRQRDCATTTTRWLWTWVTYKGERVRLFMPLGVSLTGVTDVGAEHYLLSLQVPNGVWDGTWYYYERSTIRCGGLLSWLRDEVSETQPIPIEIKGTKGAVPQGFKQAPPTAPSEKNLPAWRKAIINDGKPL